MSDTTPDEAPTTGVLLAKIRPSEQLFAASDRAGLRPLRIPVAGARPDPFAAQGDAQWFLLDAEPAASPWDQAHNRVADQLGIDGSDVVFVEPDLVHSVFPVGNGEEERQEFAADDPCRKIGQDSDHKKEVGPHPGWHLDDSHTQLAAARKAVPFSDPRTRIAHLDTGYDPDHETLPAHMDLARQLNLDDGPRSSAVDPGPGFADHGGHGTGTLSILAGGKASDHADLELGGAPGAEILPIRVSNRVILFRTSAVATGLLYAADHDCAVASLSMGGSPSKAWAEAVDAAYDKGLCIVAAGGNRIGVGPRTLVWPARYPRVIAVTGAMANGDPYKNLSGFSTLEGTFGPDEEMAHAIAAYTPNIPWAVFDCPGTRLDGEGTSASTPQVAAAATLWIERNKQKLPDDWRRVEAVRHALFTSAKPEPSGENDFSHFGNGILQASAALALAPDLLRPRTSESHHSRPIWRMLTGFGIDGATTVREEMYNLELERLLLIDEELWKTEWKSLVDPKADADDLRALLEAIIESPHASQALRKHVTERYPLITGKRGFVDTRPQPSIPTTTKIAAIDPPVPAHRRLRVYAKDPSLSSSFATTEIGEVTLEVPWETLAHEATGFAGEYLVVEDDAVEPTEETSGASATAALDHPNLLAQDGWAPSEGNMHFHQQMTYAVAMKTIANFEQALGRKVQWRPCPDDKNPYDDSHFRRRLSVQPHALQAANAYYSPEQGALLFGTFSAPPNDPMRPGYPVHTCLSHDIVAHETTHAILDGQFRRFSTPTNIDVLAFHEAFADIVALLQGFDLYDLLTHEIAGTRGDLTADSLLGKLAVQFGNAARSRESLRSAIGTTVDGVWQRSEPAPAVLETARSPHARGAVLVSAVFDALIAIYEARTADLFRLATGGTGTLPDGAIHPDLVHRLAAEAAKSARHMLGMCIRAIDYLPAVDVTFFDYLRALITADFEVVPDDRYNYRIAVVEAFSRRGIRPGPHDVIEGEVVRALSPESLRWTGFTAEHAKGATDRYGDIVALLREYSEGCVGLDDREAMFRHDHETRRSLNAAFTAACDKYPRFRTSLGLAKGSLEVHTLRRAHRTRPSGDVETEVIVTLTQKRTVPAEDGTPEHRMYGGVTLIINLSEPDLPKYRITKALEDVDRTAATADFARYLDEDPLRGLYLAPPHEQFAVMHHFAEEAD